MKKRKQKLEGEIPYKVKETKDELILIIDMNKIKVRVVEK